VFPAGGSGARGSVKAESVESASSIVVDALQIVAHLCRNTEDYLVLLENALPPTKLAALITCSVSAYDLVFVDNFSAQLLYSHSLSEVTCIVLVLHPDASPALHPDLLSLVQWHQAPSGHAGDIANAAIIRAKCCNLLGNMVRYESYCSGLNSSCWCIWVPNRQSR